MMLSCKYICDKYVLHAGLVRFGLASGIQGRWGGGTFMIAACIMNIEIMDYSCVNSSFPKKTLKNHISRLQTLT